MPRQSALVAFPLALLLAVLEPAAGCSPIETLEVDAGWAPAPDSADSAPVPGFRDAAGCNGTSGVSGDCTSGVSGGPDASPPDASPPDATPCDYVTFTYTRAGASTVWVTGDFTGWAASVESGAWPMIAAGDVWTVSGRVGPGAHAYKYVVNGSSWEYDPGAPQADDGYGGKNNVIEVCAD